MSNVLFLDYFVGFVRDPFLAIFSELLCLLDRFFLRPIQNPNDFLPSIPPNSVFSEDLLSSFSQGFQDRISDLMVVMDIIKRFEKVDIRHGKVKVTLSAGGKSRYLLDCCPVIQKTRPMIHQGLLNKIFLRGLAL